MFLDMCVLYAFMRRTDDLGDAPGRSTDERRAALRVWHNNLQCALAGQLPPGESVFPALVDLVQRRQLPPQLLFDVISGVETDLAPRRFADSMAQERYCYHVAGVVGLACLHIWGFDGTSAARDQAITCGLAFQLTNILRDVREDAQQGRVYLPQSVLNQFHCTEADLLQPSASAAVRSLVAHELQRASTLLTESRELEHHLSRDGRRMYRAMHSVYGRLQSEIVRSDYDVLTHRAQVPTIHTIGTALDCLWSRLTGR